MTGTYQRVGRRAHPPGCWALHDRCALAAARDLSRIQRDQAAGLVTRFVSAVTTAARLPEEELEGQLGEEIERARALLLCAAHPPARDG